MHETILTVDVSLLVSGGNDEIAVLQHQKPSNIYNTMHTTKTQLVLMKITDHVFCISLTHKAHRIRGVVLAAVSRLLIESAGILQPPQRRKATDSLRLGTISTCTYAPTSIDLVP